MVKSEKVIYMDADVMQRMNVLSAKNRTSCKKRSLGAQFSQLAKYQRGRGFVQRMKFAAEKAMDCIGKGKHWLPKREGTRRQVGRIFRADTAIAENRRNSDQQKA
jgi:hypothetical protein